MGDIKRLKKKYNTPGHPWNATRINLERDIKKKYGVGNKKEIWKMESLLKGFKNQAKGLLTRTDEQANKERRQMEDRMVRLGLIKKGASVDEILGLQLVDIMNRRLQTLVVERKMARSIKHARQLITHQHIMVAGRKVTSPSYIVFADEESTISYSQDSPFMRSDHSEAYDEEIARRKGLGKNKNKEGEEEEVVAFDEKSLEDPEEVVSKTAADASVADLAKKPEGAEE